MATDSDSASREENVTVIIMNQLTKFGYEKEEVIKAMNTVNNKNDINLIMEEIENQNEKKSNTMLLNAAHATNDKKKKKSKVKNVNVNEILCFYASDTLSNNSAADSVTLHLRKSPFDSAPTHNKHSIIIKKFLKHDVQNNIYYFPIGTKQFRLQFATSPLKWPKTYTILMWLQWKKGATVTTFDSDSFTPIYGSGKRLGCAAGNSWKTINDYELVYNEWQCVIVFGGDNMSRFYIGDLSHEPKSIGYVACDICGQTTVRIGNRRQGPGDVACIVVFDKHEPMESLIQLYYESILIMGNHWNVKDAETIKKILMGYIQIDGIVLIIFQLILGRLVDQFNL